MLSVIFATSSRWSNLSGGGKKSATRRKFPTGSSVTLFLGFLALFFIELPPLSPVPGTKNPNHLVTIGKSHRHDAPVDQTKAKVTGLQVTVSLICRDDPRRIKKREHGLKEIDVMLVEIQSRFLNIPLECTIRHHSS
jgi:hypothetical protein